MPIPSISPAEELTWSAPIVKSQNNNTGAFIFNMAGYQAPVCFAVGIGTKSTGDSDGAITVGVSTSATNNISNATNYTPAVGSATVATTNNTSAMGTITVDPRNANQFVFFRVTVSGTNTPAYPLAIIAAGAQKVEP